MIIVRLQAPVSNNAFFHYRIIYLTLILTRFYNFLESFLQFLNEKEENVVLGGDFCIDTLVGSRSEKELELLLSLNDCMNVIALFT